MSWNNKRFRVKIDYSDFGIPRIEFTVLFTTLLTVVLAVITALIIRLLGF